MIVNEPTRTPDGTQRLSTPDGTIAYTDFGGDGSLLILLPGAGDVRTEHRFLAPRLAASGRRVVAADLRGHGDSSPDWPSYGVAETAQDIAMLIHHLDAGPATLVAVSFAPAASLWLAAEEPRLVSGVVAISAHLEADGSRVQRVAIDLALRGPWAGAAWASFYRRWYKDNPPADLDDEVAKLRAMFRDPGQRAAARATLLAHRRGMAERLEMVDVPVLAIYGDADAHFDDPAETAAIVATKTRGEFALVPGAGHYPHVEQPDLVAGLIDEFLRRR